MQNPCGFGTGQEGFTAAEEGIAIEHDDAAATAALHLDVCTGADDSPFVAAARMGFAGLDHISDIDLIRQYYDLLQAGK